MLLIGSCETQDVRETHADADDVQPVPQRMQGLSAASAQHRHADALIDRLVHCTEASVVKQQTSVSNR